MTKAQQKLWDEADDAINTGRLLRELYNNVPKDIADVSVRVIEYHFLRCDTKTKKKVMKWLNS